MQISILSGIKADERGEFRATYPRNYMPIPLANGVSAGYLRPVDGLVQTATGPGTDRGGINWQDVCYRVSGTQLVRVNADGSVSTLGDVGSGGYTAMDYSFDRLAIASGGRLYYWDGTTLTLVDDADLGTVLDVVWVDGYFMTTDGEFLIVTELQNPKQVDPLKYGSSEADPDPVKRLLKLKNEVYALNRYTTEVFNNVGGTGFPFARVEGAQVMCGTVGSRAACLFSDAIAMLGGGRNESPSVWLIGGGGRVPIATREIDEILSGYTEAQLSEVVLEPVTDKKNQLLLMHLPDRCMVFDQLASQAFGEPIWHERGSSLVGPGQYLARGFVWCYGRWIVGDPTSTKIGNLTEQTMSHWGQEIGWDFGTIMLYNESRGAVVHSLELVALPGRVATGANPTIWASYSLDGETYSQERPIAAGRQGERDKRLQWRRCGSMRNYRVQRFRGTSLARMSFARLEAELEALND